LAAAFVLGRSGATAKTRTSAAAPRLLVYAKPFGHSRLAPEAVWSATPSNRHPIRLAVGSSPLVSPNGRWVAYDAGPQNRQTGLSLIPARGGAPRHVGTPGSPVAWAPDSSRVAVAGVNGGAVVVDVRSLRATTLRLPRGRGTSASPRTARR
jgi:hypothetical protein